MLKSGIYDFVICRGGTDMCFVLGFGRKRPDLKQYRISGLTRGGQLLPWMAHFEERRNQALASTEGLEPVSGPMNRLGRMLWWSPEERTLVNVLYHVQDGNEPRLEYP